MFQRTPGGPERSPYDGLSADDLILRDLLAADRTALANERTLLAYVRTALAFSIAGASVWHFLAGMATDVLGTALIAAGVATAGAGLRRYRQVRARIARLEAAAGQFATRGGPVNTDDD